MEVRNAAYNAHGGIDCEVNHPSLGWVPFTASLSDTNAHGKALFTDLSVLATPYIGPVPDGPDAMLAALRDATTITRRALCIACRDAGLLTNTEAIAAARGDWPALVMTALDGLTDDQKADAQMEWSDVTTVRRTAPLILLLQDHLNYTDAQVDALFGIGGQG
ncbi:hypothetical protein DS901_06685 [Loktanella sp. D2R18]|uniref:hypothetical protein n=1 Tax=Rhodobacterales TaxID=204455 RepID=UPI000DEA7D4D|nr:MULTISPECIES: hypothetical protein [Rhodobacterales]MDO6589456.1 hypothetical protein [Yoonia sp. 1_MG-2023]RBW44107.1 hypothetical protein DS901_06685 [Loktanella sp. D2R18]